MSSDSPDSAPGPRRAGRAGPGPASRSSRERAYDALVDGDERSLRDLVDRLTSDGTPDDHDHPGDPRTGDAPHRYRLARRSRHDRRRTPSLGDRGTHPRRPLSEPRGRRRGTVAVAALSGERHALPTSMAALALREDNWHVHHLGADLPAEELVHFCRERPVDLVVLTATTNTTRPAAAACAERLRVTRRAGTHRQNQATHSRNFNDERASSLIASPNSRGPRRGTQPIGASCAQVPRTPLGSRPQAAPA